MPNDTHWGALLRHLGDYASYYWILGLFVVFILTVLVATLTTPLNSSLPLWLIIPFVVWFVVGWPLARWLEGRR